MKGENTMKTLVNLIMFLFSYSGTIADRAVDDGLIDFGGQE
jgi:hypothetical protein